MFIMKQCTFSILKVMLLKIAVLGVRERSLVYQLYVFVTQFLESSYVLRILYTLYSSFSGVSLRVMAVIQHIQPRDKPQWINFVIFMLEKLIEDENYLQIFLFSYKAIFHIHGVVNCHTTGSGAVKNPHVLMEHVRDSPKINIMANQIVGPFFFQENTITSEVCLDMF